MLNKFPYEVDLDGIYDPKFNGIDESRGCIKYIGKATLQENGKFKVLADVNGFLCVVEVNIKSK